eukprot:6474539-Amphidinium_carterae.1
MGIACGALGEYGRMRNHLKKAWRKVEAPYGQEHAEVAITLNNLGIAYGALGDHGKERDYLEKAWRRVEAHYGPEHVE